MPKKKKKAGSRRQTVKRTPQERRRRQMAIRRAIFSILVLIIVALVIFFLVLRSSNEISIAENAMGSTFSRIQSFFTVAADKVKGFATRWGDYDRLKEDYETLSRENQQLTLQLASTEEMALKNERLTELLDAQDRYEALDPIYAEVIAREPGQWFETFSINRGSSDGIAAGMAVVNGDGLVGRVYEVGLNYAKVICIIDTRSAVACMVQRTRDNGVMRGEIITNANSAECYVYYLPNLNNIAPGDTVITSGTDSLYPKGLTIGTITSVSLDAGSEGSYAVVTPKVDFQHIEEVFVLREVIESDTDVLPSIVTPTPMPTPSPTPNPATTPTPSPTPAEGIWSYPTADISTTIQPLLEDDWVRT